jgi:hypothetical protein
MALKEFMELPNDLKQKFGSAEEYTKAMEQINPVPMPSSDQMDANNGLTPQTTLTDPSQYVQAQVGAAVTQPTLPQGTSILPNLALQQVTPETLQTTPGLQGQVQATTPTATVAPTIPTAEAPVLHKFNKLR